MPLDLGSISSQINRMSREAAAWDREERLLEAQRQLRTQDPGALRARLQVERFRTSWLVARPLAGLAAAFPSPTRPTSFSVVAADGSFIAPDRHNPVRYYVINTGTVQLSYGAHPDAQMRSEGQLFHDEEDLYIPHDYKILPIEGARLGMKMALWELRSLLAAARQAPRPRIALRDGSLIFWALQAEEEDVRDRFLRELIGLLNDFRSEDIPLASYVSFPNSRDVINTLRVGLCPDEPVSCDHCTARAEKREPACRPISGLVDRWLFERVLPPGARSDLFESSSEIVQRYGLHSIGFFYLNVGEEIARVEAPRWVLEDATGLGLVHALAYDQARRGGGYPPALKEAHEQAVITTAERRVVEEMVEEAAMQHNVHEPRSAKDRQKKERGL